MNINKAKKYAGWGTTALLVIIAGILFAYVLFRGVDFGGIFTKFNTVIMPLVYGFILAYLMCPIVNWIEYKVFAPFILKKNKSTRISYTNEELKSIRKYSIIATVIILAAVIYGLFKFLTPQLFISIQNIAVQFPSYIDNLQQWLIKVFKDNPEVENELYNFFNTYSDKIEGWVMDTVVTQGKQLLTVVSTGLVGTLMRFAKGIWNLIIGFIVSIYLVGSKERFAGQGKKLVYAFFSKEKANIFVSNVRFVNNTFIGFLGGKIIDSVIIGIICYVLTLIIGTPYPVLVSVIIGVTNVIPFFGPYIGAVPCVLLTLLVDPKQCLYFIIMIIFLQTFDGNILGPKILGDSTGLTGFWVLFSITIFGGMMGLVGMIVGVPIFAIIYAFIKTHVDYKLQHKGMPADTEQYYNMESVDAEGNFVEYCPKFKDSNNASESGRKWKKF